MLRSFYSLQLKRQVMNLNNTAGTADTFHASTQVRVTLDNAQPQRSCAVRSIDICNVGLHGHRTARKVRSLHKYMAKRNRIIIHFVNYIKTACLESLYVCS
jgi:hypothetical protein